jgi:uncharacterized membrane protein
VTLQPPVAADTLLRDFTSLRRACDAMAGACGLRLWALARQIAEFADIHHLSGSEIARGIGRSRGYVSRALAAARLPEPQTVEQAQRVFDVFHGVKSASRCVKDAAAALRHARTWARAAVRRGARHEAVKLAIHEAIADVGPQAQDGAVFRHVETSALRPKPSQNVSTCRNTISAVASMVVTAVLCASNAPAGAQCQYEVTVLPTIDCTFWQSTPEPTAINNLGHVAAYGGCNDTRAVVWTGGPTWTFLPVPPGYTRSRAEDLNDLGEAVGWVSTFSGQDQACLWRNGQAILLGIPPGGNFSIATGINNRSEICGYWGHTVTGPHRAFIWRKGVMTDLVLPFGPQSVAEDINDVSQITGWMGEAPQDSRCFLWSKSGAVDLGPVPGGSGGRGVAVGTNGLVSGWGTVQPHGGGPSQARASQWRGGKAIDLGILPNCDHMRAGGGNNFATVGECERIGALDSGFIFQNEVLHDLDTLAISGSIASARGISDRGQIITTGFPKGREYQALLLSPVGQPVGDVSHDCRVGADDLFAVITEWGSNDSYADADNNGVVDVDDLVLVILNWTF